jgi:hypothetical protein
MDSLCPVPGCGMWTRKMKDHAFKVHLSPFFQLPAKVTGVDKTLFRQLGEALKMVGHASLLLDLPRNTTGSMGEPTDTLSTTSSRTGRESLVAMTEASVSGDFLTAISRTRRE